MYLKTMVLFLSVVSLAAAEYGGERIGMDSLLQDILPRRICGEKLNIVLGIACSGVYNKKSGPPMTSLEHFGSNRPEDNAIGKWLRSSESEDITNTIPWLGRHNVKLALAAHERLQKRVIGIYDECCLEVCTPTKLRRYCGNPDDYNIDD